jgi:hypothetical protein
VVTSFSHMNISPIRFVPAALAIAGAALVGVAAQPVAAETSMEAAASGRSGPYGPAECESKRWEAKHYGLQVGACYGWYPTSPSNPGGGYWFDWWT